MRGGNREDGSEQAGGSESEIRKANQEPRRGDCAAIPPLRGPTRQKAARRRKSGRCGRDDNKRVRWECVKRRRGGEAFDCGSPPFAQTAKDGAPLSFGCVDAKKENRKAWLKPGTYMGHA